ncbi:MAG: Gfo/Idh/MocA family oxidoreductase [Phycisphaerae bacterium]|nr:Gfo/Idh/MocA family oxidoreductase [Phycisphaerae bacterium]
MSTHVNRRDFLKTTTAIAAGSALALPNVARGAEAKKLRVAIIGVGGRGGHGIGMAKGENITVVCDVDAGRLAGAKKRFPNAKGYQDYREMFKNPDDFDAVIISTPDHQHYPQAIRAIRAKKAVYCEKPLAWSMWEALQLAAESEKYKVATQMGNQMMGGGGWRTAYNYVKAGAIGDIKEVHTWTGTHGGWFKDGIRTPEGEDPVPDGLDWDKWLGPAPVRPYKKGIYHPAKWRGWIDFGNGGLGDWCCHLMNAFYKVYEPGFPTSVECISQTGPAIDTYPKGKAVKWEFPADGKRPAFDAFWYDGVTKPPQMPGLDKGRKMGSAGSYFVGTKGVCWVMGSHNQSATLVPESARQKFGKVPQAAPKSRGHEREFIAAAKGEIPYNAPLSNFGYGGKLTAVALMANIAARVKGKLLYDAKAQKFTNSEAANKLMTRKPRDGWYVD